METPMFVSASPKHNTWKATLALTLYISSSCKQVISNAKADRNFSLRSQMGGTFSPQWREQREESETAHSERLFMIFFRLEKWVGGFVPLQAGLFHTLRPTTVFKPYKCDFCIIGPPLKRHPKLFSWRQQWNISILPTHLLVFSLWSEWKCKFILCTRCRF